MEREHRNDLRKRHLVAASRVALFALGALVGGCSLEPIALEGKRCPCDTASGWTCRQSDGICVQPSALECGPGEASVHCVPDGLVGFFRFEEGTGELTFDSSPSGGRGVLHGSPTWTDGAIAGALELVPGPTIDSQHDYVQLDRTEVLDQVQEADYSLALWARPLSLPPEGDYSLAVKPGWHMGLGYTFAGTFRMAHVLSGNVTVGIDSNQTYDPDEWHHLVGTVSRAQGTTKIWVDASLENTNDWEDGAPPFEAYLDSPFRIGIHLPPPHPFVNPAHAIIDEVRIYARELTPDEIAVLATNR